MASWNTRTSSAHTSSLPAHVPSSTQQPPYVAPSPHPEASDGNSEFPYKLFNVLGDVTLAARIRWHQDEGLLIPSVVEFVIHVLRIYFPDMKKGWPSFQKQMSNYGFVKRDRDRNRAHYVHWDNKFCRGRPDLLPQVQPRPKESTSTDMGVQGQPPAPDTPEVPQPLGQLNPDARFELLQNRLAELEKRLEAKEAEEQLKVAEWEKLLKLAEWKKRVKVAELEKRLKVAEVEAAKVLGLETQLKAKDTLIEQLSSQLRATLSIRNCSPNTQVPTGPMGGPVSNPHPMGGAGSSSGIHNGFAPKWSIGAYNGGAQVRVDSYSMAQGMPFTAINPAILQLPAPHQPPAHHQLPNNTTLFASSLRNPYHTTGLPTVEVPMLVQDGAMNGVGPMSLPSTGPPAGAQTFPMNGFVFTSQAQVRTQISDSPRTSNGRQPFGGLCPVPRPTPPGPSRSGQFPSVPPTGATSSKVI